MFKATFKFICHYFVFYITLLWLPLAEGPDTDHLQARCAYDRARSRYAMRMTLAGSMMARYMLIPGNDNLNISYRRSSGLSQSPPSSLRA